MEQHTSANHRDTHIDILRGIAVLGMLAAHAIFYFHTGTNALLMGLERMLNVTVLTLFVFVAGLSASHHYDSHTHVPTRHLILPTLKRASLLYIAYLITALTATTLKTITTNSEHLITQLIPVILMLNPPSFTEYLPLFILLTVISLPLRNLYRLTDRRLVLTMLIGSFFYLLGILLYPVELPSYWNQFKALFAGSTSILRFPLFFYLPVYMLGLWWQRSTDHTHRTIVLDRSKIYLLIGCIAVTAISILLERWYLVPIFDPLTRWPPSIPFLTTGIFLSTSITLLLPILQSVTYIKNALIYYGRDALDIWVHHLIFLVIYAAFMDNRFADVLPVIAATFVLLVITTIFSSLSLTNNVSFPIHFHAAQYRRFRKRYVVILMAVCAMWLWNSRLPSTTTMYGRRMNTTPLSLSAKIPTTAMTSIATSRTWYARHNAKTAIVEISVHTIDTATSKPLLIDIQSVTIYDGDTALPHLTGTPNEPGVIMYEIPVTYFSTGAHIIRAIIQTGFQNPIESNSITIQITEPLIVAWTFDWEGWDPAPDALGAIDALANLYAPIRFTHFVHPRMFAPGVISNSRATEIQQYLTTRQNNGDEIALHLHMQFDFVAAAGIEPKRTNPWGLRTNEGYDIPTTEYTSNEFRAILDYAREQLTLAGFSDIQGFRAGGWYINAELLEEVRQAGFIYDSSGRSKPTSGVFRNTPWNLTPDAQPYTLSSADQNAPSSGTGLLEIPNNGLTTYESTVPELIARVQELYTNTPLDQKESIVYVSHPQFYTREFSKISPVLDYLQSISIEKDNGPVMFGTTADIAKLWISP